MSETQQQQAAYYVLPALSITGFITTVGFARSNGLFKSIARSLRKPNVTLPNSKSLLIKKWTYIQPIDNFLAFIISFFWPLVNGKNETVRLQALHFVGQLTSVWIAMEAQGAQMTGACSYLLPFGMAIQMIGAATIVPLWLSIQLFTSQGSRIDPTQLVATELKLAAIPYAIGLGLLLPVLAMNRTRAPNRKQFWVIMFQIFPMLTWTVNKALAGRLGTVAQEDGVNRAYNMAIGISALTHLASFGPSVLAQIVPGWYDKEQASEVNPLWTFVPRLGLKDKNDMIEARLHFMRWDESTTAISFVLWALLQTVVKDQGLAWLSSEFVLKFIAQILLLGPAGAAILLLKSAA